MNNSNGTGQETPAWFERSNTLLDHAYQLASAEIVPDPEAVGVIQALTELAKEMRLAHAAGVTRAATPKLTKRERRKLATKSDALEHPYALEKDDLSYFP